MRSKARFLFPGGFIPEYQLNSSQREFGAFQGILEAPGRATIL